MFDLYFAWLNWHIWTARTITALCQPIIDVDARQARVRRGSAVLELRQEVSDG